MGLWTMQPNALLSARRPWRSAARRAQLAKLLQPLLVLIAASAVAVYIAAPTGVLPHVIDFAALGGLLLVGLAGLLAVVFLPANTFCIASLIVFATLQLSAGRPFARGGVVVYTTDVLLLLVIARALVPRARFESGHRFALPTRAIIGTWLAVTVLAVLRGLDGGVELDTALRLFSPVVYWIGLYVGFSRIFRESDFRLEQFVRDLVVLSLLLIAYMFFMRVLNRPFESSESGGLGRVVTSEGDVLRRDFGFWSAYIFYPVVALIGISRLAHSSTNYVRWALVAGVGVIATLTTLIRGEIYGLAIGAVLVLLVLRRERKSDMSSPQRMRVVVLIAAAMGLAALLMSVLTPDLGAGVAERALPGLRPQSDVAQLNAQYRYESLRAAVTAVGARPLGFGFLGPDALGARGVDNGHLVHSAAARVIVYTGWLGLVAALGVLIALAVESTRARAGPQWLHPMFVGVLAMLVAYSMSAAGIAGQAHVIGVAALLTALRFALASPRP